jgi:hypothetical protein
MYNMLDSSEEEIHNVPNLSENELLNGEKWGTHVVDKPINGYKIIECECVPNLSENELLNGEKWVTHVVDKPINGYKIIECECIESFLGQFLKNSYRQSATANLYIPVGATVVRPKENHWYHGDRGHDFIKVPSSNLRTDCVIVKEIVDSDGFDINKKPMSLGWSRICNCYSKNYNSYKYTVGYEHRPEQPLDMNVVNTFGSGIYFCTKV